MGGRIWLGGGVCGPGVYGTVTWSIRLCVHGCLEPFLTLISYILAGQLILKSSAFAPEVLQRSWVSVESVEACYFLFMCLEYFAIRQNA